MEKKYQEKVSTLQVQVEKEREILSSQASNQTSKLLDEMDQLRADEGLMKERVQVMTEVFYSRISNSMNIKPIERESLVLELKKCNSVFVFSVPDGCYIH